MSFSVPFRLFLFTDPPRFFCMSPYSRRHLIHPFSLTHPPSPPAPTLSLPLSSSSTARDILPEIVKRAQALNVGPGTDPKVDVCPMISPKALQRAKDIIARGEKEGAAAPLHWFFFPIQNESCVVGECVCVCVDFPFVCS